LWGSWFTELPDKKDISGNTGVLMSIRHWEMDEFPQFLVALEAGKESRNETAYAMPTEQCGRHVEEN
jgi:hypothetical protein